MSCGLLAFFYLLIIQLADDMNGRNELNSKHNILLEIISLEFR